MEMFLMALCMSLLGIAVTSIAFAAATRDADSAPKEAGEPKIVPVLTPARFFSDEADYHPAPRVPVEALLLQLERHIRLEQAAAQSFLDCPTAQSLHSRTTSPLVH
jgi:hypothetical protein